MLPFTNSIKEKVNMYIKNGKDISELIKDVDIKGQDFTRAKIAYLNRSKCDLKGINFSHCILGSDDKVFSIIQCDISNCNFNYANFVGATFLRSCKAHNCNFKNADCSKVDYQHTDFTDSDFCGITLTLETNRGLGCTMPKNLFSNLMNGWSTNFKIVEGDK
jgi:uncharacterized protein YjbI with pentapeptide repeats